MQDKNCGTGVVEFAVFVATGLNIYGALYGQGGSIFTAIVFWLMGQAVLVFIGKYYNLITHYNIIVENKRNTLIFINKFYYAVFDLFLYVLSFCQFIMSYSVSIKFK